MTTADTGLDIRLERIVDATPAQAFAAWVAPAARLEWYAPEEGWIVEATSDLRVGGEWMARFGPTAEEMYTEEGVFTEVDPPQRVAYTNTFTFPGGDAFTTRVVVTFEAVEGKTRLVLEDKGYPSEQQRDTHENGWPSFLDAYERHLAKA